MNWSDAKMQTTCFKEVWKRGLQTNLFATCSCIKNVLTDIEKASNLPKREEKFTRRN